MVRYADDEVILVTGSDLEKIKAVAQEALNEINTGYKELGLNYSPTKCKLMLSTAKQNVVPPNITLNGEQLEYVDEFKYLGVTITKNLFWDKHLSNTQAAIEEN